MNLLEIMDWDNNRTTTDIDLDDLSQISRIEILVLTGDEIATIHYKDGTEKEYDSSKGRLRDFYDGHIVIYDEAIELDRLEEFQKRRTSYDLL